MFCTNSARDLDKSVISFQIRNCMYICGKFLFYFDKRLTCYIHTCTTFIKNVGLFVYDINDNNFNNKPNL